MLEHYKAGSKDRWLSQLVVGVEVSAVLITGYWRHLPCCLVWPCSLCPVHRLRGPQRPLLESVHVSLFDHISKKNCNGRIPCLSELKSASRPCMKFFPRCVFPNVDWPIGDNSYCLLPLLYVFSLSYILLQLKLR